MILRVSVLRVPVVKKSWSSICWQEGNKWVQGPVCCTVSDSLGEEFKSLMATGMNDFLWLNLCVMSFALFAPLCLSSMSWSGWETLSKMACNSSLTLLQGGFSYTLTKLLVSQIRLLRMLCSIHCCMIQKKTGRGLVKPFQVFSGRRWRSFNS